MDGPRRLLDERLAEEAELFRRPICVCRQVVLVDGQGPGSRDLHCEVVGQCLEVIGARDKVGLAIDLNHGANAAAGVNVAFD